VVVVELVSEAEEELCWASLRVVLAMVGEDPLV